MRLTSVQIHQLQNLLEKELGLKVDDEGAQQIGLSVMRFVLGKEKKLHDKTPVKK